MGGRGSSSGGAFGLGTTKAGMDRKPASNALGADEWRPDIIKRAAKVVDRVIGGLRPSK